MTRNLLIIFISLFVTACNGHYEHGPASGDSGLAEFVSNGERIYFTGSSVTGSPINAIGGAGHMSMHMRMHGTGCVSCHGVEREGGRLWPQFWVKAPALTAAALFENHEAAEESDGHGDHRSYDRQSLRRAITEGTDPAGEPLDSAMSRWVMSQSDLNDLIAYLEQSHAHD